MRKLESSNIAPLVIILLSIFVVFFISRIGAYLIIVYGVLPWSFFINLGSFRLHHFVYGNILITITSFLAIGLGIRKHKNWFALFYGIGLGLVLDEFVLWMGDVTQLTNYVLFIPHSLTVIAIVSLIIASLIMIRLYEIKLFKIYSKNKYANK